MFRSFVQRVANAQANKAQIRRLQMMGDHELADIGITRGNIADAVRYGRF